MEHNPFTEIKLKLEALTEMVIELRGQLNTHHTDTYSDKPLNMEQAAAYLDMAKGTLYNLTSKRGVPHFKRGTRVLFYKHELDEWLKANKQNTVAEIKASVKF